MPWRFPSKCGWGSVLHIHLPLPPSCWCHCDRGFGFLIFRIVPRAYQPGRSTDSQPPSAPPLGFQWWGWGQLGGETRVREVQWCKVFSALPTALKFHGKTYSTRVYSWNTYPAHLFARSQIGSTCIFVYVSTSCIADLTTMCNFERGEATKPIIGSSWNNGVKNWLDLHQAQKRPNLIMLIVFRWIRHL